MTTSLDPRASGARRAAVAMIVGCLLAAAASVTAATSAPDDVPSVTVRYADLDLTTEEGAQALYRRIRFAAQAVCPPADSLDLARLALTRSCQEQAIARAVQAVSSPRLAAVYAMHARRG